MSANFQCDLAGGTSPLPHFWEHTVGSGHAPLGLRADWQSQLKRCHDELGMRHVRFHGLLSDDVGTLICHRNEPLYSFFNADQIFDFLLSIGMRPFVELSFMPKTLSSGDKTVFHYQANVTPPKDYTKWAALIRKLVGHWEHRYGQAEVASWFFEVWNEPNIPSFWTGSRDDYFELYRSTVGAIKEVDASLQVGGPATAKNAWIEEFLEFTSRESLPVDFVSTHHYPTDAFGSEDDDTETQLAKSKRSVLRDEASAARRQSNGLPLYYTEWNTSSNPRDPLHDESYAAAFIVKTIMEASGLVDGYSFWTFSDIFEENYFPSMPFQGGFGLLNLQGIAKPSFRAYQLLHELGGDRWSVTGHHGTVDVWAIKRTRGATLLATNWALPRHSIDTEEVNVTLKHTPPPRTAWIRRIDSQHANAKGAWFQLERPEYPTESQLDVLNQASDLVAAPQPCTYSSEMLRLSFSLPPQAVAAIDFDFAAPALARGD